MRDFSDELASLRARVEEARQYLRVDWGRDRVREPESVASAPDLWDDPDRARLVTTELRNIHGPVLLGRPYLASGRILARGRSPRTEYFWYEATLDGPRGERVAEMLLQWRCLPRPA